MKSITFFTVVLGKYRQHFWISSNSMHEVLLTTKTTNDDVTGNIANINCTTFNTLNKKFRIKMPFFQHSVK